MRIGGKIGIGVAVLGLALGTVQAANAAPPRQTKKADLNTITLITGDQVTMRDANTISIRAAKGREKITFSRFSAGGHTYVFPSDARQLVAKGQLDQRLFDLTTLTEFGYDDAHSATVPLIVTHPEGQAAPRAARVSRELTSINGVAMTADKANAGAVWESLTDGAASRTAAAGVSKIWLDGKRKSTLDRSATQIGAPTAWAAGYTGAGVKVAVLDTGVDQTHPDLADREIAEQNFSNAADNTDNVGHGTHVASIVAGTGAKSGGKYRGIANGASILDGKVLNDFGGGLDSWIIAGMEWAAQQGADIANLSLGATDTTAIDPLEEAVETLTAKYGTLFVIAAGNAGPSAHSVGSPGSAPSALTVGAVDRDDTLAEFSSRGPTEEDGVIKPDVTAPGVEIVAALHSAGTIAPPVEDGYTALSGTSMATPHVAGAAAILAQQHPDWTGQQLKAALSGSAEPAENVSVYAQGAGRIDVARAINQTIVSEPASVHVGTVAWPHDDDDPVSKEVTYRNLGTEDVTLALSLSTTGPDGAPSDVLSLSANEITVPAGGTASVTVTGDTDRGTADGDYSGTITATVGDSVTRTPVVVTREVESYDLTMNHVDENGAPTSEYSTILLGLDSDRFVVPYDADGSETVRLPKGRYVVDAWVFTEGGAHLNAFVQPGVMLDRDVTIDADPAVTRPIDVTPSVAATLGGADVGYVLEKDGVPVIGGVVFTQDLGTLTTAQLGDALPGTTVKGSVSTHWIGEDEAYYGLVWYLDKFPTGYTKVVKRRDLARLRVDIGRGAEGDTATRSNTPQPPTGSFPAVEFGYDVALPDNRIEYVTPNVRWRGSLWEFTPENQLVVLLDSPWTSYRQGRTYDKAINYPVFSPGLPVADFPWVYRFEDVIVAVPPLLTDRDGNASTGFTMSGSMKLYRGDQLVGESPDPGFGIFDGLPAAAGRYRLTTEASRPARFGLTTALSAEWTFSSSYVDGEAAVPLNVVRFAPKLDANGSAPAGRSFLVPLRVQDETGASVRPRRLSAEVSYDEGRTWQRVEVTNKLVAKLKHPAGANSVSFRVLATDQDGNTVKQTVIRAYTLK